MNIVGGDDRYYNNIIAAGHIKSPNSNASQADVGRRACSEGLFGCPGILVANAVDVLHSDEEQSALCRRR